MRGRSGKGAGLSAFLWQFGLGFAGLKVLGFSGLGFRLLITSALKAFFSVLSFVSECAGNQMQGRCG